MSLLTQMEYARGYLGRFGPVSILPGTFWKPMFSGLSNFEDSVSRTASLPRSSIEHRMQHRTLAMLRTSRKRQTRHRFLSKISEVCLDGLRVFCASTISSRSCDALQHSRKTSILVLSGPHSK